MTCPKLTFPATRTIARGVFAGLGAAVLSIPALAHEASSLDITNAIFASRNADCASYENRYSSKVTDTQQNKQLTGAVHVTAYTDHCVLESNSIPNHNTGEGSARNFVAPVTEISGTFNIPRNPKQQRTPTALDQRSFDAILLNGVVVDILSAGCYRPGGRGADKNGNVAIGCRADEKWLMDPLGPGAGFGADKHNAHTQPNGQYHYHGNPMAMFDDHPGAEGSPVIGFAADGFPIYGSYFKDATGTVRKAKSGYALKSGKRPFLGQRSRRRLRRHVCRRFRVHQCRRSRPVQRHGGQRPVRLLRHRQLPLGDQVLHRQAGWLLRQAAAVSAPGLTWRVWPLAMATLAAMALPAGQAEAETAAANRPNILLIIADDMGLDASRCYDVGTDQAPMPVVEALCNQGMVFENAYAAPLCSPTRATLMTGQYGFRTGVGSVIRWADGIGLSPDVTSLFDVLNGNGYAGAVIGKWHLAGSDNGLDHPAHLGVGDYYGIYKGAVPSYSSWDGVENGAEIHVGGYSTSVFTDRAIAWTRAQQKPWFLWFAYNAPHAPFHVPPAGLVHSSTGLADDEAEIKRNPLPYFNAMLEAMDTEIGRLLDSMPEDVRNNTVVMFIGDNGSPNQVARPLYGDRGAKGSIFEGGTHVPLIVQGPGIAAGRSDALVNSTDLFATIAGLAGAHPQMSDAVDLAPVLAGGPGMRQHVYVEHFSDSPPRGADVHGWAIRDARYKLVAVEGEPPMLFDLETDPFEQTDLLSGEASSAARAEAADLQAAYDRIRR